MSDSVDICVLTVRNECQGEPAGCRLELLVGTLMDALERVNGQGHKRLTVVRRIKLGSYLSSWILAMSSGLPVGTFFEEVCRM